MTSNQNKSARKQPIQKEHIVAYLEILDYEKKMQTHQESDLLLAQLAYIYKDVIKWPDMVKAGGHPDISVKIFSHNVLIAMETGDDDHYPANCYSVAQFCATFQTMALTYGLLLHGAITVGKFVEKEYQSLFAYGEALVNAYKLTTKDSVLPRIVIDKCIFRNASPEALLKNETLSEMYQHSEDGIYFLNQFCTFKSFKKQYTQRIPQILTEIREMLLSEYAKTLMDKSISSEKHYFTLNQFNKYCSNHKEYEDLKIAVEIFDTPWIMPNKPRAELKTILDKNPPQSFNPPLQSEYIVAHIDFLGAAKKMSSPEKSDDFLKQIYNIYLSALEILGTKTKTEHSDFKVKIYSDNIVFAYQVDSQSILSKFLCVVGFCNAIQIIAIEQGLPVRGAITFGDFFADGIFVYGEALVRTHKLEQEAIFPRVVIDSTANLYDFFPSNDEYYQMVIKKDDDGLWYADYLGCLFPPEPYIPPEDHQKLIFRIRDGIIRNYTSAPTSKVAKKYKWMIKKFNIACLKYPRYTISQTDIAEVMYE